MRVLITGASGMLGATLVEKWEDIFEVYATDKTRFSRSAQKNFLSFDLTNDCYEDLLNWADPDVIVHCGAITNVDHCENHREQAFEVNGISVKKFLTANKNTKLILISSDAVFPDGERFPSESDQPKPANVYGESKQLGEELILNFGEPHVVVRTTIIGKNINPNKKGFVDWIVESVIRGEKITLFKDVTFTPISIWHLADELEWLINNRISGVVHVAGGESINKFEFGVKICESLGLDSSLIRKGSLEDMEFTAERSKDQTLDSTYYQEISGRTLPTLEDVIDKTAGYFRRPPDVFKIKTAQRSLSYGRQYIDEQDIAAVVEVLRGDLLTQGSVVSQFEAKISEIFSTPYTCAVSSGTAALHLAGLALNWGSNDFVITTPLSFLASANCARYCGAEIDFSDINPDTYTIDPNLLDRKLERYSREGKTAKAIVAVDYAGHPCDWQALRTIANKHQVQLVNDNCHAIGAEYHGDAGYAVKYADAVTHSYHPVKHITTGEGGAVLSTRKDVYDRVKLLRTHGVKEKDEDSLGASRESWRYDMVDLGFNYRITDFQCALGLTQLSKLQWFLSERRKLAKLYIELLDSVSAIICPMAHSSVEHAYHIFPIQIDFDSIGVTKDQFFAQLRTHNINLQVHYVPIHLQPYYRNRYGFAEGDFPNAERYYSRTVTLPLYPGLKEADIQYVCETIIRLVRH
jgi:UDP-4-amino-4,6-dideoxy-N-acetyl-beta-L-altrosamine transaminase/dTDP-4-dehydrorhamnose reductase